MFQSVFFKKKKSLMFYLDNNEHTICELDQITTFDKPESTAIKDFIHFNTLVSLS